MVKVLSCRRMLGVPPTTNAEKSIMNSPRTHASGSPVWFELATNDQAAARKFYADVFGWESSDSPPFPDGSVYTSFQLGGRDVGACYTMMAGQAAQGVPPNWCTYFKVDDVDATVAEVRATGGQVLVEPYDVMGLLRMAACTDPEGAAFSLAQLRTHTGAGAVRENNAVCWVELATRDLPRAEAFYRGLFGWQTTDFPNSPTPYRLYSNGDGTLGGLMAMDEQWGDMPSHWSIYVQVEDVDATAGRAEAAGGKLCFPAFDVPGVGRIARIIDPSGAGFYVIKLNGQAA